MIIAIDGPAGAGKSTVAKLVAKSLNFLYIDTGAMYRALTLKALEEGVDIKDPQKVTELALHTEISLLNDPQAPLKVLLDGRDVTSDIRQPRITRFVSEVAKIKEVRKIMVELQRKLGNRGNAVLDGRDIGTVVFPKAEKKFYIDAVFQERVNRRYKESAGLGQNLTAEDVSADLANRDKIDSGRAVAPLKQAEDALYIDTTKLSIEEVVNKVLGFING
ncbi:MAG: (d)CMP kinase [Candidatus Omnitrophica bacterium]|nr:(d)CMP kinase [Candidatus Omnitrophota bacterium]MDD5027265.1 (d)CMP kinase [Candidatus Omnitrophota bacterium]MDD5661858.1 (d)CMP kinase [Candidatus Omnitrophota bacterium]